jgi:hypothetical protein
MPTKQKRTVQTKLRLSNKNEDAWRTIGRAKNKHQLEQENTDLNKKADTKKTPPRNVEQFATSSSPDALDHSTDEDSLVESKLIAAITTLTNSPDFKPNSTTPLSLDLNDFPPLLPKIKLITDDSNFAQKERSNETQAMDIDDNTSPESFFVSSFPKQFPPDWSVSPANNYIKPEKDEMEKVDSSLLSENERHFALCLAPFSKEFFIATGKSKLQVSEEYHKLIRVMVWHNRYRVKQGLNYFSPAEFESFLKQEMPQEFADLGIEIDDFLSDLIKIRNVEQTSFDVFNQCFKDQLPEIKVSKSTPSTSSSEKNYQHSRKTQISLLLQQTSYTNLLLLLMTKKSLTPQSINRLF